MPSLSIFVYGTLRPPRSRTRGEDSRFYPQIAPYVLAVEPAWLPDAELYDLGAFPGARRGEGVVRGDLLRAQASVLPIVDAIEGHPKLFCRQKVTVHTHEGATEAWVYWATPELTSEGRRIAGGDWFERPRETDVTRG